MNANATCLLLCGLFAGCTQDAAAEGTAGPATSVSLAQSSSSFQWGSELTIENGSSYDFYDLAIAAEDDPVWSENLLGGDPLFPEESLTIENIRCDIYDLLIVDEDGVACVLEEFPLCDGDHAFTRVTDYDLNAGICD